MLLALLAVGTVSYAVTQQPGNAHHNSRQEPALAVPAGFTEHRDPAGFTVHLPQGWKVGSTGLAEIAITSPDGQSAALIRARPVSGALQQWLSTDYLRTESGAGPFRLVSASSEGPHVARALFELGDRNSTARRVSAVAVEQGGVATIFVALAPANHFASELPRLAHILDSFRFTPAQTGAKPASGGRSALSFVRWVDPYEQAFSADVPAGWKTEGGLLRSGAGVQIAYQISAPDGTAFLFAGDRSLPSYFVLPSEIALSLGNREGQPTGPGGPIMLRFQDAATMGQGLIRQRFGQAQVTAVRERPDLMEILRRNPVMQGSVPQASAAEIEFRLPDGRVGTMALTTQGAQVSNLGGTWYVGNVQGFVAPAPRASETGHALARLVGSWRENPQWAAGEAQHQQRMSAQYREYAEYSSRLQQQTIDARWASDAEHQQGMRDILGGTVRLKDATTGETFETGGQSRYYYRVKNSAPNAAIGTDVDFNPAPELDMTRLLRVGVE
ncbi:MAG: hypothetical protein ABJD11_12615 [Gemmatimonadota bacterium]